MSAAAHGLSRAWRIGAPLAVGAVIVAAWQLVVSAFALPPWLVPSPRAVVETLVRDRALLAASLGVTLTVALCAFALAVAVGVAIAVACAQSRVVEASLMPWAILLQVTPIVAIAPLVIIWVRDTRLALVLCATVVALFPVISSTTQGLRSVDPNLRDLFRLQHATRWQRLWRLQLPSALPYFFAGLRIASGLALIGAVVAEFVAGTGGQGAGLAYLILVSGIELNVPRLFAALVLIAATGVAFYLAVGALARLALGAWHESERPVDAR